MLLLIIYGAIGVGGVLLLFVACLLACRGLLMRNEKVQFETAEPYEPDLAPGVNRQMIREIEGNAKTEGQK